METPGCPTIRIDPQRQGDWEVELPEENARLRCRTFEEARRVAYRQASRRQPCELVICDAYHRVAHHEFIGRR